MKLIVTISLIILSIVADAASRVGGGKLSNDDDLYEMPLANNFGDYEIIGEVVRLTGPVIIKSGFGVPALIQVSRFINMSPVATESRADIKVFYESNQWQNYLHDNECIDVYVKETSTAITYVVAWGNEKGISMVGQDSLLVKKSIQKMIEDIVLLPGACSWK